LAAIIGLGAVIAGLSFYGAWWIVFHGIPLIAYYFYLIAGLNRRSNHHEVKRKNKIMAVDSAIITFVLNGIILLV
jgi:hypothetical protein